MSLPFQYFSPINAFLIRSKKLIQLLNKYYLSLSFEKVNAINVRFARPIAEQARTNSTTSVLGIGISIFQFLSFDKFGFNNSQCNLTPGREIPGPVNPSLIRVCPTCRPNSFHLTSSKGCSPLSLGKKLHEQAWITVVHVWKMKNSLFVALRLNCPYKNNVKK